jgi:anti-anti-sigma factor
MRLVTWLSCEGIVKAMAEQGSRGGTGAPPGLDVSVSRDANEVRVSAHGEVDVATAPRLYEALSGPDVAAAGSVIADLSGVSFIDSTGLRALLTAAEDLAGRLRIIPSPACRRLFAVTHVEDLLETTDPAS